MRWHSGHRCGGMRGVTRDPSGRRQSRGIASRWRDSAVNCKRFPGLAADDPVTKGSIFFTEDMDRLLVRSDGVVGRGVFCVMI
jgi:hypothetical protein